MTCYYAVRLILTGGGYYRHDGVELLPSGATLVSHKPRLSNMEHAFIFWDWSLGPPLIVPAGFSSGYHGEGPKGLALALLMLFAKDIPVYEVVVDGAFFNRLNDNALTEEDIGYAKEKGSFVMFNKYLSDSFADNEIDRLFVDKYATYRFYSDLRIKWEWLDPELAKNCERLAPAHLKTAAFDSGPSLAPCLREAFITLKARLVSEFGVSDTLDGDALVNAIFGNDGVLAKRAAGGSTKETLAMRDLLTGLFKVFRNKYAHSNVEVPSYEADAVLSMIDLLLKRIPTYRPRRRQRKTARRTS